MQDRPGCTAGIRAQIYYLLAEALAEPPDWLALSSTGEAVRETLTRGARHLDSFACREAVAWFTTLPIQPVQAVRVRYAALFLVPDHPAVAYESQACEGRLLGDASLRVRTWYDAVGLTPTDELPDHASVELFFLGYLAEEEAQATVRGALAEVAELRAHQARFLAEHPGRWLPALGETLIRSEDPVYAGVGRWLASFIAEEREHLNPRRKAAKSGRQRAVSRVPVVVEPDSCSLCGFCVQVCKLRALKVHEAGAETRLLLNAERCVGCNLCQNVCPEGVLVLSSTPDPRGLGDSVGLEASKTWHSLKVSDRVVCPGCGQPHVSQAELDAVCTRLEADASLRLRLRFCIDCKSIFS